MMNDSKLKSRIKKIKSYNENLAEYYDNNKEPQKIVEEIIKGLEESTEAGTIEPVVIVCKKYSDQAHYLKIISEEYPKTKIIKEEDDNSLIWESVKKKLSNLGVEFKLVNLNDHFYCWIVIKK